MKKNFLILVLILIHTSIRSQDSVHVFTGKGVDSLINSLEIYDLSKGVRRNKPSPTLDSAEIVTPKALTNLESDQIRFEIEPVCSVDTALLFVRYYPWKYDTLAKLTSPPYTAVFETGDLPDQDAFQVQFGYTLILPDRKRVISPPLPNRWIINREKDISDSYYTVRELASDDEIKVDGDIKEWYNITSEYIDSSSFFKLAWTPARLYAAVSVTDDYISRFDMVEIAFDIGKRRGNFLDKSHRIMRFCPKGANFMWASEIRDSTTSTMDSVIILLKEETQWNEEYTESGYTMEISIPVSLLSHTGFPELKSGFDIAIVNRSPGKNPDIITWSGVSPSERHNPESWGTIKLRQQMSLLKKTLLSVFIIFGVIIGFLVFQFFKSRKEEMEFNSVEMERYPEDLERCIEYITENISNKEITSKEIASYSGLSVNDTEDLFKEYTGTDIQGFIMQKRIQKAKRLLKENNLNLEGIADAAGFKSYLNFNTSFAESLKKSPKEWREIRLRDMEEQRREEEEDED